MESIAAYIDQEVGTGEQLKNLLGSPDMIAATKEGMFIEYAYVLEGYCQKQKGSIAVRLDDAKSIRYKINRANDSIVGSYVVVLD